MRHGGSPRRREQPKGANRDTGWEAAAAPTAPGPGSPVGRQRRRRGGGGMGLGLEAGWQGGGEGGAELPPWQRLSYAEAQEAALAAAVGLAALC
jgi:hypothetical protein